MNKLKTSFDSRGRALLYDDLKGMIFSQLGVFQTGAPPSIDFIFADKTMFHMSLEPEPLVRLRLNEEDRVGALEEIAMNEKISVP
jgi:hypothetical protein